MTMKLGARFGQELAAAVIVDSPVRSPDEPKLEPPPPGGGKRRIYPDFETALGRFRQIFPTCLPTCR